MLIETDEEGIINMCAVRKEKQKSSLIGSSAEVRLIYCTSVKVGHIDE